MLKIIGHDAHQALGLGSVIAIANDGASDGHADARRHALRRSEQQQRAEARCERAGGGRQNIDRESPQHHRAPTERIGQRAMHECGDRKRQHVGRQRLLHLQSGDAELVLHRAEAGKERVDRERADHRQRGEQGREAQRDGSMATHDRFQKLCISMNVNEADQVISTKPARLCGPVRIRIAPCGVMSPRPNVVNTTAE